MNYKPLLNSIKDFSINFAVASFTVSIFQDVWYGFVTGFIVSLVAIYVSLVLGGK